MTTEVGEPATTQVRTIGFNDEEAVAPLQQLRTAYPQALIYLSGTVTVDFPEEVKLPMFPEQYQTVSLTGTTVQMNYHPIDSAIATLKEQYATVPMTAKIIQPLPQFD